MRKVLVAPSDGGQRLDKYLKKYLREAPASFIYKMLRKKNITLNGNKATGSELISGDDEISLFLADETIEKFRGKGSGSETAAEKLFIVNALNKCVYDNLSDAHKRDRKGTFSASRLAQKETNKFVSYKTVRVIYEDEHIIIADKPVGMLSQRAVPSDFSMNEWLQWYLGSAVGRKDSDRSVSNYTPSVCHRLDRNTRGLIVCSKTYVAGRAITDLIKDRSVEKHYICGVYDRGEKARALFSDDRFTLKEGYLYKDKKLNKAKVSQDPVNGGDKISTLYRVLKDDERASFISNSRLPKGLSDYSFIEARLITGRSHQIRAQLSSLGLPLLGDKKYMKLSDHRSFSSKWDIHHQLLYSCKLVFPHLEGVLAGLSEREICLF